MRIYSNCEVTPLARQWITERGITWNGNEVTPKCFSGCSKINSMLEVAVDVPNGYVIYGRGSIGVPGLAYLKHESHRRLPRETYDKEGIQ